MLHMQHGDIEKKVKSDGFDVLRILVQEHFDRRAKAEPHLDDEQRSCRKRRLKPAKNRR